MPDMIQYVSDIHLETYKNSAAVSFSKILKPVAPYLALCGDIGYPGTPLYEPFLRYCSENFKHVFYIAGNHEFYNDLTRLKSFLKNSIDEPTTSALDFSLDTYEARIQKIREICNRFPNIHFLEKETYEIPDTDIVVIGCTLWTKLKITNPYVLRSFNDFYRIVSDNNNLLTPKTYDDWNQEHLNFLGEAIYKNDGKRIVVLTHHCPTYDIITENYRSNDYHQMNSFFANSDLGTLFDNNIKAWICGHTHGCNKIEVNGTIVATNTFGYEWETIQGFRNDAVIEI